MLGVFYHNKKKWKERISLKVQDQKWNMKVLPFSIKVFKPYFTPQLPAISKLRCLWILRNFPIQTLVQTLFSLQTGLGSLRWALICLRRNSANLSLSSSKNPSKVFHQQPIKHCQTKFTDVNYIYLNPGNYYKGSVIRNWPKIKCKLNKNKLLSPYL